MKKRVFFAGLGFIFLIYSVNTNAQDPRCAELKTQYENTEKLVTNVAGRKVALDEFINLMNESPTEAQLNEELQFTNQAISKLNGKIMGGDQSAETKQELKLLQDRAELIKLRKAEKFSFADERWDQQQAAFQVLKAKEEELNNKMTEIQKEMKQRKCPAMKTDGDDGIVTKELDDLAGSWNYKGKDGTVMKLILNGSGASTSGKVTSTHPEMDDIPIPPYEIFNCRENGENKLVCNYSFKADDYEKTAEFRGTVNLTISATSINTNWQESAIPKVSWKPGAKQREIIPQPLRSFSIVFTK